METKINIQEKRDYLKSLNTRKLTVCQFPHGKKYAPGINLKGYYLQDYGFNVGDMVDVICKKNKIIISKVK